MVGYRQGAGVPSTGASARASGIARKVSRVRFVKAAAVDLSPIGKRTSGDYREDMRPSERSVQSHQHRRGAAMLLVFAWVFWLHRWGPAFLVVTFVAWMILHNRLEAGLGEALRRQWRRAWPPGPLALIALILASALAFVLGDAPATAKVLPVALAVLALWLILFGNRWTLFALPRWLGGNGPSPFPVRTSDVIGVVTTEYLGGQ